VAVAVGLGVAVKVGGLAAVKVAVGLAAAVTVGGGVGVALGVSVGLLVADGAMVADGVGVAVGLDVTTALGSAVGWAAQADQISPPRTTKMSDHRLGVCKRPVDTLFPFLVPACPG
jgi:hypothetical protein